MEDEKAKNEDKSELLTEIYFILYHFLSGGPCKNAAETLKNEIIQHKILTSQKDLLGNEMRYHSFNEMLDLFDHVSHNYLPDLMNGCMKMIRQKLPDFKGFSSLLSYPMSQRIFNFDDTSSISHPNSTALFRNVRRIDCRPNIPSYLHHYACQSFQSSAEMRMKILKDNMFSNFKILKRTVGHLESVYCTIFDVSGKTIITGSDDSLIKFWKTETGHLIVTLRGHSGPICDLAVNNENTLLASASSDKTICVWNMQTSAQIVVLSAHSKVINSVSFSPYSSEDVGYLTSIGSDGIVCFWKFKQLEFDTDAIIFDERAKPRSQMLCLSYSPGGSYLVVGASDALIRVYKFTHTVEKTAELEGHTDKVDSILFDSMGERFLSGSADGTCRIWTPSGYKWTSVVLNSKLHMKSEENNIETGKKSKTVRINMVIWACNDRFAVMAVTDYTIKVWDVTNGLFVANLEFHTDEVFSLEVHPIINSVIVSAGHDGKIVIWNLSDFKIIKFFTNEIRDQGTGAIVNCKISPNGQHISATDSHGNLLIIGSEIPEAYQSCPEDQFFHTDYRPITRNDDLIAFDEQTNMLPHLMPPPILVNIEGIPHPVFYQIFAQRRLGNRRHVSLMRILPAGEFEHSVVPVSGDTNLEISVSRLGLREYGDIEGVRRAENVYLYSDPSAEERQAWANREIVKKLNEQDLQYIYHLMNLRREAENDYYHNIRQANNIDGVDREGRFARLMSLKASISKSSQFDHVESGLDARVEGCNLETINPRLSNFRINISSNHLNNDGCDTDDCNSLSNGETTDEEDLLSVMQLTEGEDEEEKETSSGTSEFEPSNLTNINRNFRRRHCTRSRRNFSEEEAGTSDHDSRNDTVSFKTDLMDSVEADRIFNESDWFTYEKPRISPYFPQVGDEIFYLLQAHKKYVNHVRTLGLYALSQIPCFERVEMDEIEYGRVTKITFTKPPVVLCCVNILKLNSVGKASGSSFSINYRHYVGCPDILILKQTYENGMKNQWKVGDRFRRFLNDCWKFGEIKSIEPYSKEFPNSDFLRYIVKMDDKEPCDRISRWDIFPFKDTCFGSTDQNAEEMKSLFYTPDEYDWENEDYQTAVDRISSAMELFSTSPICIPFLEPVDTIEHWDYLNYVSYPTDITRIINRLKNGYFRRKESLLWEIKILARNANTYNLDTSTIVMHANIICQKLTKLTRDPSLNGIESDLDETVAFSSENVPNGLSPIPEVKYRNHKKSHNHRAINNNHDRVIKNSNDSQTYQNSNDTTLFLPRLRPRESYKRSSFSKPPAELLWISDAMCIVQIFKRLKDAEPFLEPVDITVFTDYLNYVDVPMDFSTVETRLRSGEYFKPKNFIEDVKLIFDNSRKYNTNPRSQVYAMTIRLNNLFISKAKTLEERWQSSLQETHNNSIQAAPLTRHKSNELGRYASYLCDQVCLSSRNVPSEYREAPCNDVSTFNISTDSPYKLKNSRDSISREKDYFQSSSRKVHCDDSTVLIKPVINTRRRIRMGPEQITHPTEMHLRPRRNYGGSNFESRSQNRREISSVTSHNGHVCKDSSRTMRRKRKIITSDEEDDLLPLFQNEDTVDLYHRTGVSSHRFSSSGNRNSSVNKSFNGRKHRRKFKKLSIINGTKERSRLDHSSDESGENLLDEALLMDSGDSLSSETDDGFNDPSESSNGITEPVNIPLQNQKKVRSCTRFLRSSSNSSSNIPDNSTYKTRSRSRNDSFS